LATRSLVFAPDPILSQKTRRVKKIDLSIHTLIEDMIETMHEAHGVGIAANQVGVPLRIAVIQLPDDQSPTVLINPEVIRREGERDEEEGCLSIPGYRGIVRRSLKIRVKAMGLDGKLFRIRSEADLMAQALEHETDHLDGHLYVERLISKDELWKIEEIDVEGGGLPPRNNGD